MTNITCFFRLSWSGWIHGKPRPDEIDYHEAENLELRRFPWRITWLIHCIRKFHKHKQLSCVQNIWLIMVDYKDMIIYIYDIWYIYYRYICTTFPSTLSIYWRIHLQPAHARPIWTSLATTSLRDTRPRYRCKAVRIACKRIPSGNLT